MRLAVVLVLVATQAFATTYVCQTRDGRTIAASTEAALPKDCGPVKQEADIQRGPADPFEPYDSEFSMTPPTLSGDQRHITGKLRNEESRRFEFIAINFSVYNQAGEQIDSTSAVGQNLDAHETWNYDAVLLRGDGTRRIVVKSIDRR